MSRPPLIHGAGTSEAEWSRCAQLRAVPETSPAALIPQDHRVVLVAPHPDDEILGAGGLLAMLSAAGHETLILAATDGTASHPGMPARRAAALGRRRAAETRAAVGRLELQRYAIVRFGLPDGRLGQCERELANMIRSCLRATDAVLTTWTRDGHPDHEATGRAALRAARDAGATAIEYPVWAWHWAVPGDDRLPWKRAHRIMLDPAARRRKRAALAAYRSQTESIGGAPAILPPEVLERFLRPFEIVFR